MRKVQHHQSDYIWMLLNEKLIQVPYVAADVLLFAYNQIHILLNSTLTIRLVWCNPQEFDRKQT